MRGEIGVDSDILAIGQKLKKISESKKINVNLLLEQLKDSIDFNYIPIEIFAQHLAPLQAVVVYLKDVCGLRFCEIALRLNRDDRTIWATYQKSNKNIMLPSKSTLMVPLWMLKSRSLSIFEIIVKFLYEDNYRLTEIAKLLNRNTSTVWTALNRARQKEAES